MRATATVVAELDRDGRTVVRVAAGSPPLTPRVTGPGEVYLAATAGGPLGGDEQCIDVRVGPGASLTVRTVAASIALPGTGEPSRLSVRADVAEDGCLIWLPEPTVAAAGCQHHIGTRVHLAAQSRLVLREELVAGRHGEPAGVVRSGLTVTRAGAPVLAQTLTVGGPAWPPGVPSRAIGSLLVVGPPGAEPAAASLGAWAVVMPLAHPGATVVSVLADDARSVRFLLDEALSGYAGIP
jgi:urease accessory protein